MKIYTRTGDDGSTGLFGGDRVEKNHPRIRAYGTVDEVNSSIGVACSALPDTDTFARLKNDLIEVQRQLFVLGADLATPNDSKAVVPRISDAEVRGLEETIDRSEEQLPPLANFILPGGHAAAASLHLARTTCRRAEREVVEAMRVEQLNALAIIYLNRLSDLLFVLARLANHLAEVEDVPWKASV